MSRTTRKYHDHAIGNVVLFVVVFLATTLIDASPRNHEGIKYLNLRRVGFPSNRQMAVRRAIAPAEEEKSSRLNDASVAEEELEVEDLVDVCTETMGNTKNCTLCIGLLIKEHPEICEVVQKIDGLRELIPLISEVVKIRMGGGRRMDLKWMVSKGRSALMQLYDVLKRLAAGIRKLYDFLGAVEFNFGSTLGVLASQFNNTGWLAQLLGIKQGEAIGARNFKHQDQQDSLKSFRSCASIIMMAGIDPCDILTIINQMQLVLNELSRPEVQEETFGTSELPIKLHSDDLTLSSLLEALQSSLAGTRREAVKVVFVKPEETVPKGFGIVGKRNSQRRKHLVNENIEDVVEVFETPDSKIAFLAPYEVSESEQTVSNLQENLGVEVKEVAEEPQARFMDRPKNRRSGSFQYSPRMMKHRVPLDHHMDYQDENVYRLLERRGRRWNDKK